MSSAITEQGGLAATCIPLPQNEAECFAAEHFGLSGLYTRFDTEKDDTFRIATAGGESYVLKVTNPAESREEISFQTALLKHVANKDASLPVPRVLQSVDGEDMVPVRDQAGQNRFLRLLSYIDGTPLANTTSTVIGREEIGRVLGRLRYATADFSHAADKRVLAWDVQHLAGLAHLLEHVKDESHKKSLATALSRYQTFSERMAACRTQVVHNDFSQSNIVVSHESDNFVRGIIDFGDAVRTSIAIDVSTALLNQLPRTRSENQFDHGRDVLRGYLAVAELTTEELELIPQFVMGRVIARALLTIWRASMFPDNYDYIMRNTEQGWHQLDWFLSRSAEDVSAILK